MKSRLAALASCLAALLLARAAAAADDIRIALVASKTGPSEIYARDTERGLRLAVDYFTNGTGVWEGRKVVLIVKDDQYKPELAKARLAEAYSDDDAQIGIGTSWSGGALAQLPVAKEYKRIFIAEPAIADSLTGEKSNRYVFRASRNSFQDALASAVAVGKGASVAFLAPDYVYGRDGVKAFKDALVAIHSDAKVVHEEYAPPTTSDFTAPVQRIFDAMKGLKGPKRLFIIWPYPNPLRKVADMDPGRYGIELGSIGGANLDQMKGWVGTRVEGGTFYYYTFPKNKMNDWLVKEHEKRYGGLPPDLFVAGGFNAGAAALQAIKKAGSTDAEKLIAAMEGMTFDTCKGPMTFRKEDHQALQVQYHFRSKMKSASEWDLTELVREIPASEMPVPIQVNFAAQK